MKNGKIKLLPLAAFTLFAFMFMTGAARCQIKEVKTYKFPEARQGVAVDENYIYVVDTRAITKYEKGSGKLVGKWEEKENGPIIHLDSGIIIDGKLYSSHSNYPQFPMTSSIEIWDAKTLEHVGSHSFGIHWGSCTWIDRHDNAWWAAFAHYNKWSDSTGTDVRWTTVVKFDDQWRMLESWVFPKEVSAKFGIMSNSGGSWGPDGYLYCTGHDAAEFYVMKLPSAGSILELVKTIPVNCTGQGFAWDRSDPGSVYTINKSERLVIHSRLGE